MAIMAKRYSIRNGKSEFGEMSKAEYMVRFYLSLVTTTLAGITVSNEYFPTPPFVVSRRSY
jgi:heme/copper-type cytochrome/quinol oxidase subunit 4